jgi:hypothetical protein
LDTECADKPPAPFSDRHEWLSWRDRGAVPMVGAFDFTRRDDFTRRSAGRNFTFDAHTLRWLPQPLQDAFTQSFNALLDPSGSPSGRGTPPATWGVSPFDLHHCHLVLRTPPGTTGANAPGGESLSNKLAELRKTITEERQHIAGAKVGDANWSAEYRRRILAPETGVLKDAADLAKRALAAGTASQPILLIWHSFEFARWRPMTMITSSPPRFWETAVTPNPGFPVPSPPTEAFERTYARNIISLGFVVTKSGVITVMPGSGLEAFCLAGLVDNDVARATRSYDEGTGSSTLKVTADVTANDDHAVNGGFRTVYAVSLRDGAGNPVTGALVRISHNELGAFTLSETPAGSGDYKKTGSVFPRGYFRLAVTRGADNVRHVGLLTPRIHEITQPLANGSERANQPLTVRWTDPPIFDLAPQVMIETRDFGPVQAQEEAVSHVIPPASNPARANQRIRVFRFYEVKIAGGLAGSRLRVIVRKTVEPVKVQ